MAGLPSGRALYLCDQKKRKNKNFIAIFNFSDEEQEDYELDTEEEGKLSVILDTDWDEYGGNTKKKKTLPAKAKKGRM